MGGFVKDVVAIMFASGVAVAVVNWSFAAQKSGIARTVDRLRNQLQSLYGPLCFFIGQNEKIVAYTEHIGDAYKKEYCDKEWSPDEKTQNGIQDEARETVELDNRYMEIIRANNNEMVNILKENYAWIDVDDIELFRRFVEDWSRDATECTGEGKLPRRVQRLVMERAGLPAFYRSDFNHRVNSKFKKKLGELQRLETWWLGRVKRWMLTRARWCKRAKIDEPASD